MPELPEVETTRRFLLPFLEGARIEEVDVRRDRMVRRNVSPHDVSDRLVGRRVERLGRTGKFIISDVGDDMRWVIHLGMSGRLSIDDASPEPPHTNVVFTTDGGAVIRFVDPRTFGFTAVWTDEEWWESPMSLLGPDALDHLPEADVLEASFARRRAPIKAVLLDQRVVSGLGNIYADEVLARAGVRPERPAGDLTPAEVTSVRDAIGPVLEEGLANGGTSLDDLAYLLPDGRAGTHFERLRVYGRTDLPCRECGTPIERTIVAQRSSHFCPRCQT